MAVAPPAAVPPDVGPAGSASGDARPPGRAGHAARVLVLVLVSLAVHVWLVRTTSTTARDSIGFAQLALQYESPRKAVPFPGHESWLDVLRHGEPPHPPGYPLVVLLTSKVVRATVPGELTDQMLLSTQVASVVAGVLLTVPSYALGCLLFGRFTGFAAGLVLQLLPVLARVTSDGLTESWYLLFFTSGAAAGTWAIRRPSAGRFLLAGAFSGLAYLVRPEGLVVALAVAFAAVWLNVTRRAHVRVTPAHGLGLAAGVLVFAGPYMVAIGDFTLKRGLQGEERVAAKAGPLLAVTFNPGVDGGRAGWVPRAVFKEAFKAFHYGVFFYALAGFGLAFWKVWKVRTAPWLSVTLILGAGNLTLLGLVAYRAGYISERHTLPVVLVGVFYAAYALEELPRQFARLPVVGPVFAFTGFWRWFALAALVASCLPVVVKPLHENRAGHRVIGAYLKEHATLEDTVIDPYTWAEYFSGRSVLGVPRDPPNPRYRWAILEEGEPNSLLTRKRAAENVRDDRTNPAWVAASWDDPARPGRRITLYQQDARK